MVLEGRAECEVTFAYAGTGEAREVCLAGDFNSWSPTRTRLARQQDGSFTVRLVLPEGDHQYMFVVDGVWRNDPTAAGQVPNAFGTLNSVMPVGRRSARREPVGVKDARRW